MKLKELADAIDQDLNSLHEIPPEMLGQLDSRADLVLKDVYLLMDNMNTVQSILKNISKCLRKIESESDSSIDYKKPIKGARYTLNHDTQKWEPSIDPDDFVRTWQ